jgi:glycosyltransferase involved in cell wall biosynthesis
MKLALVHDFLSQDGGAEKVLEVMHDLFPEAPTYTLFFDARRIPRFASRDIRTSFLQKAPFALQKYQWYLPLMPAAIEHLDLSAYDVVVSNASAFAKGVITRPDALHICYCHTPTRYLWSDTHSYARELRLPRPLKSLLPPLLSHLRLWDQAASQRVDRFVANSEAVRRRIAKYYGRDSEVIHPPVDVERFSISDEPKTYFLTGGRLVAYKRFDLVIEACNQTGIPLKIFGSGPVEDALRKQAGDKVEFLGRVSDGEKAKLYAGAKAFVHPQEEDFGITPVEAMAAGVPVVAYARGGAIETVEDGVTGELFDAQRWEDLADILIRFDANKFDPIRIREHAKQFSRENFEKRFKEYLDRAVQERARA